MISNNKIQHVGVISNPLSGGNRKGLADIRRILAGHTQALHHEVQTPEEAAEALMDFARQEVSVVVVNGGDGTIQAVLTPLFRKQPFEEPPLLALLRAGTDSVIPGDVGLPGPREKGLQKLLEWARRPDGNGVIEKRNIMRVQPAPDQEPRYGMIFGAAIVYQATQYTHRNIHAMGLRGELAPGLAVARFVLAIITKNSSVITPVPITLNVDEHEPLQGDFLLVVISTLERLFLGLRPFWGSGSGPLPISAITARPKHFVRIFPSLARGRTHPYGTPENGYFSYYADKIRMTMDTKFTLDGQVYTPNPQLGPVVVENGGQASFLRL
jgi:hypothetical protein